MTKDKLQLELIDTIMDYFKHQLISEVEENISSLPIFNNILQLMLLMNKNNYSYSLKDIDDTLFDTLIKEISHVLFI